MQTNYNRLFLTAGLALGLFLVTATANGQSRVYEKDLAGEWKLVIDISKQGDSALERILLNAVDGLLDEVDIRFDFQSDNQLFVYVSALGSDAEKEVSEWAINKDGQLLIDDSDSFSNDSVWMMKDGRLQAYEMEDGELAEEKEVYLERIKLSKK